MARAKRVEDAQDPKPYDYRAAPGPEPIAANAPSLSFNGAVIHEKGAMISLTDMWRAAGSDQAKRPAEWIRYAGSEFIAHMADVLNMGSAHIQTTRGGRGAGQGQTFAHWQIALAYAKYLSPQFHMWCNTVVRAHMEGAAAPATNTELDMRTNGIVRSIRHEVAVMRQQSTDLIDIVVALKAELAEVKAKAGRDPDVKTLVAEAVENALVDDPRRAALNVVSLRELLDKEHKVPTKGRRSLQRRIFVRLSAYCLEHKVNAYRCPHSGVWLFDRNAASSFVRERCTGLIADHLAKRNGQGVLRLVPKA